MLNSETILCNPLTFNLVAIFVPYITITLPILIVSCIINNLIRIAVADFYSGLQITLTLYR